MLISPRTPTRCEAFSSDCFARRARSPNSKPSQKIVPGPEQVLPADAERPILLRYDPSLDPVMELSLSGEGERYDSESGLRRLRRLADLRKPALPERLNPGSSAAE